MVTCKSSSGPHPYDVRCTLFGDAPLAQSFANNMLRHVRVKWADATSGDIVLRFSDHLANLP
jgi:hypothetical protein